MGIRMSTQAHVGPFIGRAQELNEIGELLQQEGVRLVTLTGLGGIGKTRLAHEAAARVSRHDFPDGVAVISLASVRDPGLLAEVIAQELAVPEDPEQTREQDLLAYVKKREMLLVLDNFEQVRDGRYLVEQLLESSPPGFVILVTSQHVLEIGWERAYPVLEMIPPQRGEDVSAEMLRGNDAVRLFESCALSANPAFRLTDSNAPQIGEICRTVEGIPLALELAAARIRSTDPARLLKLLSPRLGILGRDDGDRFERHRTMANAINWSYGLLTLRQQRLMRRLSVFAGGFSAESASVVGSGGKVIDHSTDSTWLHRTPEQDLHNDLDELVKVSLLRFEFSPSGHGRYRMLGAVREFGLARLEESGEEEETRWTFVGSVLNFAEEIKPALRGDHAADALIQLEIEHSNVQAALEWAIEQGTPGSESALRICTSVWSFWKQRGYLREAEHWLRAAIASAGDEETLHLGNGHLLLGHTVNDQRFGWACYEQALSIYRRLGTPRYVAGTLNSLGQTAIGQGDYRRARALLMETLRIVEQKGSDTSPGDLAHVHYQLGVLAEHLGELDTAVGHLDTARLNWEEAGQSVDMLNAVLELGHVYARMGRFGVAYDLHVSALGKARTIKDIDAEGRALCELGLVESQRGDDALALKHLESALRLYRDTGYPFAHLVTAIEAVAAVCSRHDQAELATTLLGFADNWRRRTGTVLHPDEESARTKVIDLSKRQLGASSYDGAWNRGQRLIQLDDVIQALSTIEIKSGARKPVVEIEKQSSRLTPREHEVLCHLATGMKYRGIATEMGVSESTIKKFVERIYDALDVNNRTAATAYAFQHGICAAK